MAPVGDPPYHTQQWSGLTHYICPRCGYNSFQTVALDVHPCQPRLDEPDAPPESPPPPPDPEPSGATPSPEQEG